MTHTLIAIAFIASLFSGNTGPFVSSTKTPEPAPEDPPSTVPSVRRAISNEEKEEILWLARIIYSETKVEAEMPLIGWVVRNRVETGFRGSTYREVALSKNQFSGLNATDSRYAHNISLDYTDTDNRIWQKALKIAEDIYFDDEANRPFPQSVRHFYSPIAVNAPSWADDEKLYHAVQTSHDEPARFAFYVNVQ